MASAGEVFDYLNELAPVSRKLDFDNVGLLVGDPLCPAARVLLALDITDAVIGEAAALDARLIVSHHPLFLKPLSRVVAADSAGAKVTALITHGISAVCMHTNLDAAEGGVNDALAAALGLSQTEILNTDEGISRVGALPAPEPMAAFLRRVSAALAANGLRYVDAGRPVSRVGLCGGSGGDDIPLAVRRGCDTFLTADVKHHQFLQARELGLNLVDAGHFPTENVIIPVLREKLAARFPGTQFVQSRISVQPESFYVPE